MEVSIVIPTRNRSERLKNLLHSILKQTMQPKEIIVIDDSKDLRTKKVIQQLRERFSEKGVEIRYIMPTKNQGKSISRARNLGAKEAKGDIVV